MPGLSYVNPRYDPSPPAVRRRQLDPHPIANQHADEISIDPIGDVRRHQAARLEPNPIEPAGQLLRDHALYLRATTGTSLAVRIHGPSARTATVCSKCADKLLSRVTAVHPSASTFTAGRPAFTIGSIASTMPSANRGPRPGSP